jgi:hypothetical protein
MFILYKILTSFPVKFLCFLFFILVIVYWLRNGLAWSRFQSADDASKTVTKITETLRRRDPAAAAELEQIRHQHNINALAATLQERQHRDGVDGLVRLAQEGRRTRESQMRTAFDLSLAEMALKPELIINADQRQSFLNAHANHLQHLHWIQNNIENQDVRRLLDRNTDKYLTLLEKASQNPDEWRRVRDNPMMVQLMLSGVEPEGLEFYDQEKEWLDDVLYSLLTSVEPEQAEEQTIDLSVIESESPSKPLSKTVDTENDQWTRHILQTIRKNHPYFRNAMKEYFHDTQTEIDDGLVFVFDLFERHGRAIQICVDKGAVPLEELLGVMFANPDYCDKYLHSPEHLAARLLTIRREMPHVWEHADRQLVFQLTDDVPEIANELCRKFGTDDIAVFLYLKYGNAVPQAAAAVNQFGDLAIYILNRYSESELFRKYLKDFSLGVRIVPYTAMFEDKGLERLVTNQAWLDKFFDSDGNPKQDQWYETLPGGGAVKVAGNWAKGYPSEWNEIGWAALDVADAALLVASLGTSAPASAMKTAGTAGIKVGTKAVARDTVTTVIKSGTRATTKGARNLAKTQKTTLFRQGIRTLARQPFRLVPQGGRLLVQTAKIVAITPAKKLSGSIYRSARSVYAARHGVNPAARKIIYRSLLATGITITLWNRTIPALKLTLPQMGEKIGAFIADSAKVGAETTAAVLNGFLEQLLNMPNRSRVQVYLVYWGVAAVMVFVTSWLGYRLFLRKVRA